MQSSHAAVHVSALFDEPNLIADAGAVTLLGGKVSDGTSWRGGARFPGCGQAVVAGPATPVIWSQIAKRTVISAR